MSAPIEITDDLLEAIGNPVIAFTALTLIADQAEELGTVDLSGMSRWEPETRERSAAAFRERLAAVRKVLDGVEAALPEASP